MVRYCQHCKRTVEGKKTFHGVAFILLILFIWGPGAWLGLVGGTLAALLGSPTLIVLWLIWMSLPFIYVIYHLFGKTPRCPICNTQLVGENSVVYERYNENISNTSAAKTISKQDDLENKEDTDQLMTLQIPKAKNQTMKWYSNMRRVILAIGIDEKMKKQKIIGFVLAIIGFAIAVSSINFSSLKIFFNTSYTGLSRIAHLFEAFPNFLMGIVVAITGTILFFIPNIFE